MAAEGHANIKVNGSVRLVGDVPNSRGGARTTTSVPPEMSTTFIETTTTLSTTTTRKQRSPPTIQVTEAAMLLVSELVRNFPFGVGGDWGCGCWTVISLHPPPSPTPGGVWREAMTALRVRTRTSLSST